MVRADTAIWIHYLRGAWTEFVRARRLKGRGAGWIYIQFWTADPRLHAIAGELGAAYQGI